MSHHVMVRLPDGRIACADYRQPIVVVMRKINRQRSQCRPVGSALLDEVAAWLDEHPEQACDPAALVPCKHRE